MKYILVLLISIQGIFSESSTTSLTEPKQIEIFHEVTTKIRCICLPSLPIKSCSFNNCAVSALLKQFIENRIRKGESSQEIIQKLLTGYGESAIEDPIVQKFMNSGSESMANGILYGFGEKILAEPDSKWINLTIYMGILLGAMIIYFYFKKFSSKDKKSIVLESTEKNKLNKYLKDLES
jgi:cytochrome c-type biogenesis protein CcmH/NrfF